jgi:hypothetical protein
MQDIASQLNFDTRQEMHDILSYNILMNEDDNKPITVNGITYATQTELDERIKSDALALANLIFDIYQEKNAREQRLKHGPNSVLPQNHHT